MPDLLRNLAMLAVLGLVSVLCPSDWAQAARPATDAAGVEDSSAGGSGEAGHEGIDYNKPPLEFNPVLFLFTLVLFVAFVLIMRKVAWMPLVAGLNEREARVVNAEKRAETARREAEKLRVESERRLAEVQEQVKSIVARARTEAESRKQEIVADAEREAQRIKADALSAIASAREQALESLNQVVDAQVALATEHVVGRRL